jgi:hypothetical protein
MVASFMLLEDPVAEFGSTGGGTAERVIFDALLVRIRDLNRLELAGEAVRAALEALAADASWQSRHVDRDLMVGDPVIPAAQRPAGGLFHDGSLVVLAGEAADGIDAGEERDRREHDLIAGVLA